ncbi:MAG: DUF3461 family protein [Oceanospirillaceae bacterium]|nr:DUF3461 family protein [Oceanospirillaceae bacterium]
MSNYPNLEQLGVISVHDITKYNLTREARVDVLKISYKRSPGSFLPNSRKYHFARGLNRLDNGPTSPTGKPQHVAPQLLLVIEELRSLMANRPLQTRIERKANISERLDSLEAVIDSKLHHLQQQLKSLGE